MKDTRWTKGLHHSNKHYMARNIKLNNNGKQLLQLREMLPPIVQTKKSPNDTILEIQCQLGHSLAWTKGWSTLSHDEHRCLAVPKLQEVTETFYHPRKMKKELSRQKPKVAPTRVVHPA